MKFGILFAMLLVLSGSLSQANSDLTGDLSKKAVCSINKPGSNPDTFDSVVKTVVLDQDAAPQEIYKQNDLSVFVSAKGTDRSLNIILFQSEKKSWLRIAMGREQAVLMDKELGFAVACSIAPR